MSTKKFSPGPRGLRGRRRLLVAVGAVLALLAGSGGATRAADPGPWFVTGNGGTSPSSNFLGTTNNQPLVIRTNNVEALRVTAGGSVGIGTSSPSAKLAVNGDLQAAGAVNAVGGVQENGTPLSSKYLLLGGGNYTSPAPSQGQVLLFNGTSWVPDSAVTTLQGQVSQLQTRLAADESTLTQLQGLLGGVSLSADGTTLTVAGHGANPGSSLKTVLFTGVNVQVVDGTGQQSQLNGLGNLIVGYADNQFNYDRSGSHNLITGDNGGWSSYGGLLAGHHNQITGPNAVVSGGCFNTASGSEAVVSGGCFNTASGFHTVVSGGGNNTASGDYAAVSGGAHNVASGQQSAISGGTANTVIGGQSTILGGYQNTIPGSVLCAYFPDSATTSNCH